MKLELKHLAPYLPYGLKIEYFYDLVGKFGGYMESNLHNPIKVFYNGQDNRNLEAEMTNEIFMVFEDVKPILRPLSDLTKDELSIFSSSFRSWCLAKEFSFDFVWKNDLDLCFKYHIDVFGLIPAGLAVSIHDVGQVIA